jgi:hypothetical protein
MRMQENQGPPQAVIEQIASLLATGYLRMRNERAAPDGETQPSTNGLDSAPDTSPDRAGS